MANRKIRTLEKKVDSTATIFNHNVTAMRTDIAVIKEQVNNIHENLCKLPCEKHQTALTDMTKTTSEIKGYLKIVAVVVGIGATIIGAIAVAFLTHTI